MFMGMPCVLFPAEQQALGASENQSVQEQENEQLGALTPHKSASMRGSIPPLLIPFYQLFSPMDECILFFLPCTEFFFASPH